MGAGTPVLMVLSLWETMYVTGSPLFDSRAHLLRLAFIVRWVGGVKRKGPRRRISRAVDAS